MNKQNIIEQLIQRNIFKLIDGRNLYEGTSKELKLILEMNRRYDSKGSVAKFLKK
ncbi:Fur-regulated basic protein FbpA [Bacillus cereus]|uniref:Fur-regulated basic protein FbpA n=1 Tax=Bacillus cereus TaxID=1396 RepID=UPI0009E4834B|nr:Fur-regulated basic protein FbpA [Bacillus cereus]